MRSLGRHNQGGQKGKCRKELWLSLSPSCSSTLALPHSLGLLSNSNNTQATHTHLPRFRPIHRHFVLLHGSRRHTPHCCASGTDKCWWLWWLCRRSSLEFPLGHSHHSNSPLLDKKCSQPRHNSDGHKGKRNTPWMCHPRSGLRDDHTGHRAQSSDV